MSEEYKIKYLTPEGEVNSNFRTQEALQNHKRYVIDQFGESSIKEVKGPDINEGKQLLNEG